MGKLIYWKILVIGILDITQLYSHIFGRFGIKKSVLEFLQTCNYGHFQDLRDFKDFREFTHLIVFTHLGKHFVTDILF